jgi:hypothetical protein
MGSAHFEIVGYWWVQKWEAYIWKQWVIGGFRNGKLTFGNSGLLVGSEMGSAHFETVGYWWVQKWEAHILKQWVIGGFRNGKLTFGNSGLLVGSEMGSAHLQTVGYGPPLIFLFAMVQQPQWAKVSSVAKIQLNTPHSVGILWTGDQLVAETSV